MVDFSKERLSNPCVDLIKVLGKSQKAKKKIFYG